MPWVWDAEWIWTEAEGWQLSETWGPKPVDWYELHHDQLGLLEVPPPPPRYGQRWAWYAELGRWAMVFDRSNF